ncbi:hypothetical protein FQZ97_1048100 [compost metagenome]
MSAGVRKLYFSLARKVALSAMLPTLPASYQPSSASWRDVSCCSACVCAKTTEGMTTVAPIAQHKTAALTTDFNFLFMNSPLERNADHLSGEGVSKSDRNAELVYR